MKYRSIKKKITILYTGCIAIVLLIVLAGMLFYIKNIETNAAEEELQGKSDAFYGRIQIQGEAFTIPADLEFYNDGVIISVYDNDGTPVAGSIPSNFPIQTELKDGIYQRIEQGDDHWIVRDKGYEYAEGKVLWIRAISTVYGIERAAGQITAAVGIAFLIMTGFIAGIGFRMLSAALKPVDVICSEAGEISKGEDLSKRLTLPQTRDEMYRLTIEFNQMFDRLEDSFEAEKQFSSDVSHELRTPLSVIRSQCEYMLGEAKTEEEAGEIRVILNQAEKVIQLITQLLTISRCERGGEYFQKQEFNFSFMAEMVVDTLQEMAEEKQIELSADIEENLKIIGEETLLMRMLMNLIENAIYYGKEHGFVKVKIRQDGDRICGSVQDNGIGIAEENLDKIWKRFYREDKSRSNTTNGTGLGLAMVKWIVQLHHGEIKVFSEKGAGSEFVFYIPNELNFKGK
ncbi:MAG TPA: HAMP domain-containing histidine kinase [Candidatus Fimousia stercorigallinarum]|nr:HAMP domain-containing histidine kinase [Candidatus Fimousia stercorigallinarum]